MRTIIIICIYKEKGCTSLCWFHNVFEENSEATWDYRMPVRDVQELVILRLKLVVDIVDVINERSLTKFFFALKYIYF